MNAARTDRKQKVFKPLDFMAKRPKQQKRKRQPGDEDPVFKRLDVFQKLAETHGVAKPNGKPR